VIIIAELILAFSLLVPFLREYIPGIWGGIVSGVIILLAISPFLRAIVAKKNHSEEFQTLWNDGRFNRGYLISLIVFRFVLAVLFVMFIISTLVKISVGLLMGIAVMVVGGMIYSRYLKKQSILIERRFLRNFNIRDTYAGGPRKMIPRFATNLLSRDLHMADFEIPVESLWVGKTLSELALKTQFDVHVVAIFRGNLCLNIPGGEERLYPYDRIQVIGSDEQLLSFTNYLKQQITSVKDSDLSQSEVSLRQFMIDGNSVFKGKTIGESGIRESYKCLIVGLERGELSLRSPSAETKFKVGDLVWIVGEESHIYELMKSE
ncbi:MAG: TrkA C-terminal domain-containing protein, partial [Odoribacter sp.]|nr:TrkA C-terminal domain-containing protein [Odoribacter sp.]